MIGILEQGYIRLAVAHNNGSLGALNNRPHGIFPLAAGGGHNLANRTAGEFHNGDGAVVDGPANQRFVVGVSKNLFRVFFHKHTDQIYRMAAERMGVPIGEVIFLDDNFNADRTAKQAGAQVIGVYDASSAEYEAEIRAITDGYVVDFSELPGLADS